MYGSIDIDTGSLFTKICRGAAQILCMPPGIWDFGLLSLYYVCTNSCKLSQSVNLTLWNLQFFRFEDPVTFVVVAMVDAFHIDFTAIDVIGQSSLEDMLDFNILDGTTLHREKKIFFTHPAPVNDLVKLGFETQIQPNTSAAPISFSEGVGDIHFHVLFHDLIKSGLLANGAINGAILENFVVAELLKSYHNNAKECLMWYYRDSNSNEIDMVIESDGMLHPLEIKRSVNPGSELISAFNLLDKASVPRGNGAILCMRPKLSAINSENYIVPIWMI